MSDADARYQRTVACLDLQERRRTFDDSARLLRPRYPGTGTTPRCDHPRLTEQPLPDRSKTPLHGVAENCREHFPFGFLTDEGPV